MPSTKSTVRLAKAANAMYALALRDNLSFPALRIAQRAVAAQHGYTLDALRSALQARTTRHFVARKLYL
jgi:hypothetical protein